jgi:hypothetical protein
MFGPGPRRPHGFHRRPTAGLDTQTVEAGRSTGKDHVPARSPPKTLKTVLPVVDT